MARKSVGGVPRLAVILLAVLAVASMAVGILAGF